MASTTENVHGNRKAREARQATVGETGPETAQANDQTRQESTAAHAEVRREGQEGIGR